MAVSLEASFFFMRTPMDPPILLPYRLEWDTKTHRAEMKESLTKIAYPLKMYKYISLYNWFWKVVAIIYWYAFKRCLLYSSLSVSFILKRYHVYLKSWWVFSLLVHSMDTILCLSTLKIFHTWCITALTFGVKFTPRSRYASENFFSFFTWIAASL